MPESIMALKMGNVTYGSDIFYFLCFYHPLVRNILESEWIYVEEIKLKN